MNPEALGSSKVKILAEVSSEGTRDWIGLIHCCLFESFRRVKGLDGRAPKRLQQ